MKLLNHLILLTFLVSYSCKKEQPAISAPVLMTYPNYGQLKVGNYWVYERFEVDPDGNATAMGIIDTCRIEKDTIINGETYFKYVRDPYFGMETVSFIRDSLHYIITSNGRIIFSSVVFNHVFREFIHPQGTYEINEWMIDKDKSTNTPYGNFTTSTFQMILYMEEIFHEYGNPRYMNFHYAENIGIVSETLPFFYSNPNYTERRLVNYHKEQ